MAPCLLAVGLSGIYIIYSSMVTLLVAMTWQTNKLRKLTKVGRKLLLCPCCRTLFLNRTVEKHSSWIGTSVTLAYFGFSLLWLSLQLPQLLLNDFFCLYRPVCFQLRTIQIWNIQWLQSLNSIAWLMIIAQNNKYCRQIWILLTTSFHSVSTGHKQARPAGGSFSVNYS